MNVSSKILAVLACAVVGMFGCGLVYATPTKMDFNLPDAGSGQFLNEYYNGGCSIAYTAAGSSNSADCNGPTDGVTWTNALVKGTGDSGLLNGLVSDEPSPFGVLDVQFPEAGPGGAFDYTTMNVASGFGSLSFAYVSPYNLGGPTPPIATIWSGLGGTGTQLGSADMSVTGTLCGNAYVSCWDSINLSFSGIGQSATFTTNGSVYLDDVGFGAAAQAVPEPAVFGMFGFGVLLIGMFAALRRRDGRTTSATA